MSTGRLVNPRSEWILRHILCGLSRALWRPELVGPASFPPGPCFIYGNHANNYDPFIINLFTPWGAPTAGVMTHEFLRKGVVAHLFRGIGLLPTRKHVPEPHLIRQIYRLLDQNRTVVIYPEGGRRWDGRPAPWIEATAKLFVRAGVPVYPVVTEGSYVGWPRWARFPRPARIKVRCLDPLHFDRRTPLQEALPQLKAPIDLDENEVPDAIKPKRAFRPAEGIHRLLYRDPETGANGGLFTPDGTHVVNRAATLRLKMLPDSRLLDEATGTIHTTGDLYARVRHLPLAKNSDGAFAQNRVLLHTEDTFPDLTPHGPVQATLFDDAIRLQGSTTRLTIGLDEVLHSGIERNYKLQLTTSTRMIQLSFTRDGSALHWDDVLKRLKHNAS